MTTVKCSAPADLVVVVVVHLLGALQEGAGGRASMTVASLAWRQTYDDRSQPALPRSRSLRLRVTIRVALLRSLSGCERRSALSHCAPKTCRICQLPQEEAIRVGKSLCSPSVACISAAFFDRLLVISAPPASQRIHLPAADPRAVLHSSAGGPSDLSQTTRTTRWTWMSCYSGTSERCSEWEAHRGVKCVRCVSLILMCSE